MAQLIVRNIPEDVVRALKVRAAAHGRSTEAEHRELLRAALTPGRELSFKDYLLAMPRVGEDADFNLRRGKARRVDL
jgi:plasmid stability protein